MNISKCNVCDKEFIKNVPGYGEVSIKDLINLIAKKIDYSGSIVFDYQGLEGAKKKLLKSHEMIKYKNDFDSALNIYLAAYSKLN